MYQLIRITENFNGKSLITIEYWYIQKGLMVLENMVQNY